MSIGPTNCHYGLDGEKISIINRYVMSFEFHHNSTSELLNSIINEYSRCRVRVESEYRKSQVESKYEYRPAVLEYESEYGITVLEYGLEYRAPVLESVLESSDLPSRNIPVSFFLPVQIRQWTSGSLEGEICCYKTRK